LLFCSSACLIQGVELSNRDLEPFMHRVLSRLVRYTVMVHLCESTSENSIQGAPLT
jgi:hypothetical protein